jgi:hypothetical protein
MPSYSQNPSFRIYDVDAVTGEVLDFYHYRPDLAKQGLINNVNPDAPAPVWNLVYSAREAYNLPSLNATSWFNVAMGMSTNDTSYQVIPFVLLPVIHVQCFRCT